MTSPYVVWRSGGVAHACVLDGLEGVEGQYGLNVGEPRAALFPDDASFSMSQDYPYEMVLTDSLVNIDFMIVASPRLRRFLEARGLAQVEYLPVAIHDHRGRLAGEYFIVHPLEPVDCLDIPACGGTFWSVDPANMLSVERLAIDPAKIPPGRELFRPRSFYEVILVRRELADAIDAAGFTGIRWLDTEDYPRARA